METVLIVVLALGGALVARLWLKRWHEQHGGDERNDHFDIWGSGG